MPEDDKNIGIVFPFQKYKVTGTVALKNGDPVGAGRPKFLINFKDHDKELPPIEVGINDVDGKNFEREVGFNEEKYNFLNNTNYEVYLTLGADKQIVRDNHFLRIVNDPLVVLTSKAVTNDSFTLETSVGVPISVPGKIEQPKLLGHLIYYTDNIENPVHTEEIETKKDGDIRCVHTITKKFSDIPELATLSTFKVRAEFGKKVSNEIIIEHKVNVKVIELHEHEYGSDTINLHGGMFVNQNAPVKINWGDNTPLEDYNHTAGNSHHYPGWSKEKPPVVKLLIHDNSPVLTINAFQGVPNFLFSEIDIQDGINIDNAFNLFNNQKYLVDVELPKDCTKIPKFAFAGCEELGSIVIPDSVTEIGSDAFESATVKSSLTLPKSLKTIGQKCFYNMTIPKISIPENTSKIELDAFLNNQNKKLIDEVKFNWIAPSNIVPYDNFGGVYLPCDNGTMISIPDGQAGSTSEKIRQYYIDKGYKCPVQSYYARLSVTNTPKTEEPNAPEIHGLTFNTNRKDQNKYINVELVEQSGDNWIPTGKGDIDLVKVTVTDESGITLEQTTPVKNGYGSVGIVSLNRGTRKITVTGAKVKQVEDCSIEDCWMYIEANNTDTSKWDKHGASDCNIKSEDGVIKIMRESSSSEDSGLLLGMGDIHYPHFEATARVKFYSSEDGIGRQLFAVRNETPDMKSNSGGLIPENEINALYAGNLSKVEGVCAGGIISNNTNLSYKRTNFQAGRLYEMTLKSNEPKGYQCIVKDTETGTEIINEVKSLYPFKKVPNVLSFIITSGVDMVEIEKIVVKSTSTPQDHAATLLTVNVENPKPEYHVGDTVDVKVTLDYYETKDTKVGNLAHIEDGEVTLYQVTDKYGNKNPIELGKDITDYDGMFIMPYELKEASNDCLAFKAMFEGTVEGKTGKYQPTYEVYYNTGSKVLPKGAPTMKDLIMYNNPTESVRISADIQKNTVQGYKPVLNRVMNEGAGDHLQRVDEYTKIDTGAESFTGFTDNSKFENGKEYVITFEDDNKVEHARTNNFKVYKGVDFKDVKGTIE